MKVTEGKTTDCGGRVAVVVAKFNQTTTGRLLDGAVETLKKAGVDDDRIDVFWVPGAFELPSVANVLAESGEYAGIICLGVVIRGETTHDQHINRTVAMLLGELGVRHAMPIIFGVLTCNTLEQAIARSGGEAGTRGKDLKNSKIGNKGIECAEALLEMIDLFRQLPSREKS